MKLSIITVNYNNLAGLKKTHQSIAAQLWRDFEWIVVDGGSTDGSREYIEAHAGECAWWCSERDGGVFAAMNKGIEQAKGEYLSFMNSGDAFHAADTLQRVFDGKELSGILYGKSLWHDATNQWEMQPAPVMDLEEIIRSTICHQATFIPTSLLKGCGYSTQYRVVSDWRQWMVWLKQGIGFQYLDLIVADYDATGLSATAFEANQRERRQVFEELFEPCVVAYIDKHDEALSELQSHASVVRYNPELEDAYEVCRQGGWKKRLLRHFLHLIK